MIKFKYFISFACTEEINPMRIGNTCVTTIRPIETMDDLNRVQILIKEEKS